MKASNPLSNPLENKAQAWSALFAEPMSELVQRYTASVFFDKRLWQADIRGSVAHAQMLHAQGIISADDFAQIERGLVQIEQEIASGQFVWKLELEDVHLNIEARLTQLIGDAGKRLHTGRSRNDQVATDIRLWLRGEIDVIAQDGNTLVFVEVRQRKNSAYGGAAASITATKQRRIIIAAQTWLNGAGQRHASRACRFDAILLDGLDSARIEWLRGAFDAG